MLRYFNTTAAEYAVIFTPNATGACRLVAEAYPWGRRTRFVLTADNHNSVHGIREYAQARGAHVAYAGLSGTELRISAADVTRRARPGSRRQGRGCSPTRRSPTSAACSTRWAGCGRPRTPGTTCCSTRRLLPGTNRLDLSAVRPEFVAMSWYKVFGFPTGVGCLLARRDALARLRRPWFSGGTILAASAQGGWHRMLDDEAGFEDGTVNFLSIPDVTTGIDWISGIGVDLIHQRVSMLTGWLLECLGRMRHSNGAPLVRLYGPSSVEARGGTVALNFLDPAGQVVDERAVARDAADAGISLRTGCFCNPGAGERAFGLTREVLRARRLRVHGAGMSSVDDYLSLVGLPTGGAVRVSLGVASTLADVDAFLDFAERTYRDRWPGIAGLSPRHSC